MTLPPPMMTLPPPMMTLDSHRPSLGEGDDRGRANGSYQWLCEGNREMSHRSSNAPKQQAAGICRAAPSFTLQVVGLASEMPVFKCATVCASNMNRSMEGHKQLHQSGFKVSSYGVGRMVLLLNFAIFRNISCITALI